MSGKLFPSPAAIGAAFGENWRWPHFTPAEMACHCRGRFCAGEIWLDAEFMDALEALRRVVGRPLTVTSAHRCDQWNAAIGGAPLSRHKQIAVDISLHGHDRFGVLAAAESLGFTGIGMARNFIHLDRRKTPARWYYQRSKSLWQT